MNTIEIKLLENKSIIAYFNGYPHSLEGGYRIVAGEVNATKFKITSIPIEYSNANFQIICTNSKGLSPATQPVLDEENSFVLPVEMAVAGYGQIVFKATIDSEVVLWTPLKIKIWDTNPNWVNNAILSEKVTELITALITAELGSLTNDIKEIKEKMSEIETNFPQVIEEINSRIDYTNQQYAQQLQEFTTALYDVYARLEVAGAKIKLNYELNTLKATLYNSEEYEISSSEVIIPSSRSNELDKLGSLAYKDVVGTLDIEDKTITLSKLGDDVVEKISQVK